MRAYDMLTTMPAGFWEQPDRATRALFAGMIKHRQWSQACCCARLTALGSPPVVPAFSLATQQHTPFIS